MPIDLPPTPPCHYERSIGQPGPSIIVSSRRVGGELRLTVPTLDSSTTSLDGTVHDNHRGDSDLLNQTMPMQSPTDPRI